MSDLAIDGSRFREKHEMHKGIMSANVITLNYRTTVMNNKL